VAEEAYRIGQAANVLGVRVETLRRWEREGKVRAIRTGGGHREIPASEVARLLAERRERRSPTAARTSVRNQFPGIVVSVQKDRVAATVEIMSGPHRIVSLLTREAADDLGLRPGLHVVAAVKATSVFVQVPE
jgi:molybdopterin-binding protein